MTGLEADGLFLLPSALSRQLLENHRLLDPGIQPPLSLPGRTVVHVEERGKKEPMHASDPRTKGLGWHQGLAISVLEGLSCLEPKAEATG